MSKPEAIQKATEYIKAAAHVLKESGMSYSEIVEKLQSLVLDVLWHGAW